MRVFIASSSDKQGGAARAAYRLYLGLKENKVDTKMFVQQKSCEYDPDIQRYWGESPSTIERAFHKYLPKMHYYARRILLKNTPGSHSFSFFPDFQRKNIEAIAQSADILNLHWICSAFLNVNSLQYFGNKPIVWTLHDAWPMAGTEHYFGDSQRFKDGYRASAEIIDIQKINYTYKFLALSKIPNLTIVTPSQWLGSMAKESSMFKGRRIEVIPNSLETDIFYPEDKAKARSRFGIPLHKKVILFGADCGGRDERKGYHFLFEAIRQLSLEGEKDKYCLVTFGSQSVEITEYPVELIQLGRISNDDTLRLAYSAADVLVVPSIEDNLPNVILEGMSCGIPVVGFNIGGLSDIIRPGFNGFLATPFNSQSLLESILKTFDLPVDLSKNCQEFSLSNYSLEIQGKNYKSLFEDLLKNNRP